MITKRDVIVAAVTAGLMLGVVGWVHSMKPVIGTTVVQWAELEAEEATGGKTRTYIEAATSTLLDLTLQARTLESGATPHPERPHTRPREEVLIVKDGVLELELEEETHQLKAGSAVFLAPNEWHALRNTGDRPVTYYRFQWVSPGMNGERQDIGL